MGGVLFFLFQFQPLHSDPCPYPRQGIACLRGFCLLVRTLKWCGRPPFLTRRNASQCPLDASLSVQCRVSLPPRVCWGMSRVQPLRLCLRTFQPSSLPVFEPWVGLLAFVASTTNDGTAVPHVHSLTE